MGGDIPSETIYLIYNVIRAQDISTLDMILYP
jgi:hypothetical protein